MVFDLQMIREDMNGYRISYSFIDEGTGQTIATANNNAGEPCKLFFAGRQITVTTDPKLINKFDFGFKYPVSNKLKKTVGFPVTENGEPVCHYYSEALTVGKCFIFKRNIGCTVFGCHNETFLMFRVGFASENSHYYCIYKGNETVAIVERQSYYNDNTKAKVYVTDSNYLQVAFIAAVEEIVAVLSRGDIDERMDPSAGNYISRYQEERELLDRGFIERAKAFA